MWTTATLAKELEQLLLAVYEVSPWTAIQIEEVLTFRCDSCALAEDEESAGRLFSLAGNRL